jgi:hypothetical protein
MNKTDAQAWLDFYQPDYFFHDGKHNLECDSCDKKFKKGELVIQSDAGDNYCEECSTE